MNAFYRSGPRPETPITLISHDALFRLGAESGSRDRRVVKDETHRLHVGCTWPHDFVRDPRTVGFSSETMITREARAAPVVRSECQDRARVNQTEKRTPEPPSLRE